MIVRILLVLMLGILPLSCTSGSGGGATKIDLKSSLVARIPANSLGFFKWDGGSKAYQRLLNSPWSGGTSFTSFFEGKNSKLKYLSELLSAVGLSPTDNATWQKVFSEAVFFVGSESTGTDDAAAALGGVSGLVFRSDGIELQSKLDAIKAQLKKSGETVSEFDVAGASGFSFVKERGQGQPPLTAFVSSKGDLGVFSTSKKTLEEVLASDGSSLPPIASSSDYKAAIAGFPGAAELYGFGYFDLKSLAEKASNAQGIISGVPGVNGGQMPFDALAISLSMAEAPKTNLRLFYDESSKKNEGFSKISSSSSGDVLASLPAAPLAFFSLDGSTLAKIFEQAKGQVAAANPKMSGQLGFLNNVKRLGLAARISPVAQSILPIPDLLLLVQTDDTAKTMSSLQDLVTGTTKSNPMMASMQWTERTTKNGLLVKSLMSPLGIGAFLATKDDVVVLTSSDPLLQEVLSDEKKGRFEKSVAVGDGKDFITASTLGNLYVDFEQLASFLESMGGLLAMYAPQNDAAGKLFEPSSVETYKKMGRMFADIKMESGKLELLTYYSPKKS